MKKKKVPLRMCVGCQSMRPKKELIRVVKSPKGEISIDLRGKEPGRGAYLCNDPSCLEKARRSKALEKTFGQSVQGEIYEMLVNQLNEGEYN
ncbi:MAG: YlxR family protein [Clostridiales bacterium]|nr:YlxR family protein [Clostridiales bacterium]